MPYRSRRLLRPCRRHSALRLARRVFFRQDQTGFVPLTKGGKGYGYTFSDGTVGNTQDAGALIACGKDAVLVNGKERWPKVALVETDTRFESHGVMLAGRLMEAPCAGKDTPLVVYAHGSESSGWIDRARDPYQMVGRGLSVFVYDKRGTGLSEGEYTQNFPRLADDLVAASREAKWLAQGRYGRFGLTGVSQGGWIAPLAQARAAPTARTDMRIANKATATLPRRVYCQCIRQGGISSSSASTR